MSSAMGNKGKRVPARSREEMLRLQRNGVSVRQISTRFDVSRTFVYGLIGKSAKLKETPGP